MTQSLVFAFEPDLICTLWYCKYSIKAFETFNHKPCVSLEPEAKQNRSTIKVVCSRNQITL